MQKNALGVTCSQWSPDSTRLEVALQFIWKPCKPVLCRFTENYLLYTRATFWIRISSSLIMFLLGVMLLKNSPLLHCFKSDQDDIWPDHSSSKCASIDGVRFLIWCHTFQIAAMTSALNRQQCPQAACKPTDACDIVSLVSVLQFLIYYTAWAIKKRATFIFTITLANVDRFQ